MRCTLAAWRKQVANHKVKRSKGVHAIRLPETKAGSGQDSTFLIGFRTALLAFSKESWDVYGRGITSLGILRGDGFMDCTVQVHGRIRQPSVMIPKLRLMQFDWQLLVLRLLVCEVLPCSVSKLGQVMSFVVEGFLRREFSKFMSHHVFGDRYILVVLAIVYLKLQSNEARKYGCRARLCPDRRESLACLGPDNGYSKSTSAMWRHKKFSQTSPTAGY